MSNFKEDKTLRENFQIKANERKPFWRQKQLAKHAYIEFELPPYYIKVKICSVDPLPRLNWKMGEIRQGKNWHKNVSRRPQF